MSYLRICLSLFYAASFLKSASLNTSASKPGVSLKCNQTEEEVEAGKDVTLYCVIFHSLRDNCMLIDYTWSNTTGSISCNTDQYTCKRDNQTYVLLTISGVNKTESYSVYVETDCGFTTSSAINVQVKHSPPDGESTRKSPEATSILGPVVLGIFATLAVFGILCFLFRRKVVEGIRHIRRKQTQTYPVQLLEL